MNKNIYVYIYIFLELDFWLFLNIAFDLRCLKP